MIHQFKKINGVKGTLQLPGDKSISHRAVMFSSLAEGDSVIYNCLDSQDVNSTINCFRKLGIDIVKDKEKISVKGRGLYGLQKPSEELDCGNSGTLARLIAGILAAQNFESVLAGDASLSSRPMKRVIEPLMEMGARFEVNENQTLPLKILPGKNLHPVEYTMKVASAQVKSSVLLAGLFLDETTKVIEKENTRNHTENLLKLKVEEKDSEKIIYISNKNRPLPATYFVPSDVSTAAFFIVLASLVKDSELLLKNVLLNETRNGIITIMQRMGADIKILNQGEKNGELSGDILIKGSVLKNCEIEGDIIPNIIDEIPVLSVAGLFAEGDFVIRNARELRVKETDRIHAVCSNMKKLGIEVREYDDGFVLSGNISLSNQPIFDSFEDHRIAMAFGVLSMLLECGGEVKDFECCAISNPKFLDQVSEIVF